MGTQVRSFPSAVAARRFVESGGLGKIFKIEQSRNSYRPYWYRYAERSLDESDTDWKAFLMHRKYRPWDAQQYAGWFGYREFSRGPHSNLMVHFIDLVHHVTASDAPARVMTMGGSFRWNRDGFSAPDSVETILEYPDKGFLVRYSTTFGTKDNSFLKFFGTRGVMDATRWSESFKLVGAGVESEDRLAADAKIPEAESTPHMLNFLECIRTRREPNAPIEAGYKHSVAVIMADESLMRGRRIVYDPQKRQIREG
jgi:predicted dehydrogenase